MFAGGEKHRITTLVEHRREHFSFDSIFLFGPDLDAARAGYARTNTGVAGEYVLDLLATGTTISAALRQDFNEPFQDEFTWRFYAVAEGRADRRTAAREHRARRHQSELHRAVRLPHQHASCRNPDLIPESSIGWDVGWEQTFWNGRVVVDVTYFNARLENEIVFGVAAVVQSSVRNLDGTSTRQGVETTAQVPAVRLAHPRRHLHLHGRARRQGHPGNPPSAPCGVRFGDRSVRSGPRQGDGQCRLQRQDARYDLHLPVLDHHAQRLHAGRRA